VLEKLLDSKEESATVADADEVRAARDRAAVNAWNASFAAIGAAQEEAEG